MLGTNRRRKVVRKPLMPRVDTSAANSSTLSTSVSVSQSVSQRYDVSKSASNNVSKAPVSKNATLKRSSTKSLLVSESDEISFLTKTLDLHGLQLVNVCDDITSRKRKHVLRCPDQSVFIKRLSSALQTDLNGQETSKRLVEAINIYLEDPARLRAALDGTETCLDGENELSRGSVQDSPVRLLLRVRQLQLGMVKLLCSILKQVGKEVDKNVDQELCSRIVAQLKFLDEYFEPEDIANALLDTLKGSSGEVQRELVYSLADVVDERYHSIFVQPLLELKDDQPIMTNAVLDAFSNILIDNQVLAKVQSSMLDGLAVCSLEDVPPITKFLLQTIISGEEIDVVQELRNNLRVDLGMTTTTSQIAQRQRSRSGSLIKDVDVLTLHIISTVIQSKPKVADAFFRVIESINRPSDHKPLDLLILLELQALPKRRRVVESLMRNKIRSGCLNEKIVSLTWSQHKVLIEKKFDAILDLAEIFSTALNEAVLTSFALVLYKETFRCLKRYFKQGVVADLVSRIHGNGGTKSCALKALREMVVDLNKDMAQFELFLSSLLNYIEIFTLKEFAQIVDALSYLTFAKASRSTGLQETLDILVRKLLSLSSSRSRRQGVLASLVIVRNILLHKPTLDFEADVFELESVDSDCSSTSSASNLNSNADKMARVLLQLVFEKTKSSAEINALFMDELAAIVADDKLSMSEGLRQWIFGFIVGRLDDDFIIDGKDHRVKDGGTLSAECKIYFDDNKDDRHGNKVVNIAGLIPKKGEGETKHLCRLLSHFCLLQKCAQLSQKSPFKNNKVLSTALRQGFLLPDRELLPQFATLSLDQKDFVCTSIFFCVNFFIETINAAVALTAVTKHEEEEELLKKTVLYRLNNLIDMRTDLLFVLRRHTQYIPSAITSVSNSELGATWSPPEKFKKPGMKKGAKKVGRKRKLEDDPVSSQHNSQNAPLGATTIGASFMCNSNNEEIGSADLDHYAVFFRELSLNTVVEALGFNLVTTVNNKEGLGAEELCFLLNDLLNKLNKSMPSKGFRGLQKKPATTSSSVVMDELAPDYVLALLINKLDILLGHASEILDHFKTIMEENDGIIDSAAVFNSNSNTKNLSNALLLIFTILKTVIGYSGFSSGDQKLKDALRCVARRSNTSINRRSSVNELVTEAIEFLSCEDTLLDVSCATTHLQLLETISQHNEADEEGDCCAIGKIAESYLKREWRSVEGNKEQGTKFNKQVQAMLKTLLNNTSKPIKKLKTYVCEEMKSITKEKNGCSSVYPTFNKATLGAHFRIFIEFLVKQMKSEIGRRDTRQGPTACLNLWTDAVTIMGSLVHLLESHPSRAYMGPILRNARVFIECFMRNAMPVVDRVFKSDMQLCVHLLKEVQSSTRFLQRVCTHSKIHRDASLATYVPGVKKALEALVYRVKATCALHNMLYVVEIGVLKNKELNGEIMLSQSMMESTGEDGAQEEEEEEGENENDDEQSDVELIEDEDEEDEDENDTPEGDIIL